MTPDKYQAMALKTWYAEDNPLYLDPRHPLIKLAGEAGEILDLYGKDQYKPGFDWWDCKCKWGKNDHRRGETPNGKKCDYTPLILDELGDWWYYFRVVTWQQGISIEEWASDMKVEQTRGNELMCLSVINLECARILKNYQFSNSQPDNLDLWNAFLWFMRLLKLLNCTLDYLTELNFRKLNSEPTAHGWLR